MQATMALLINTAREIGADKPCMTQHTQRSGRFEGLWHRRFTKTKRKEDVLKASASSFGLLCRCCLFFVGALSTPEKGELCVPFVAVV